MKFKQSPPGFQNVRGPLIRRIQTRLSESGFDPGPLDGVWGSNTTAALRAWQRANNVPSNPEIDEATWTSLTGTPPPELSRRGLQLTAVWEGTGYGGTNGNFDGQGITWGVVGFTWRNGELQAILEEIRGRFPQIFVSCFGDLAGEMTNILKMPRPVQMDFAQSISRNGGNSIDSSWASAFKKLGNTPEVVEIENQHANHYWIAGQRYAQLFRLTSETGQAMCFDIAVQNTITHAMIEEVVTRTTSLGNDETQKMRVVAHIVADHANPRYYGDVLKRKLTFAEGQGSVHGDSYDIGCWGIG